MGNRLSLTLDSLKYDDIPQKDHVSEFDPHYGFEKKRKERVLVATPEEMDSMRLLPVNRGYCAHLTIAYLTCKKKYAPFHKYKCLHENHAHAKCEFEDWVIRMKDYERERRLVERRRNSAQAA